MDWMGRWWDVGGMEGPTLAGAGTGAPPLALERRRAVGSGGWQKFCRCCKDVDYLCRSSKMIQIDCTKIVTNTSNKIVVKNKYDTIVLWLHTNPNL